MVPCGIPIGMLCGVPGNLEHRARTLKAARFSHLGPPFVQARFLGLNLLLFFSRFVALLAICGLHLGSLLDPFGSKMEVQKKTRNKGSKREHKETRQICYGGCLSLKKRIFDPLLLKRLAEFGIELNTPCVPWRHGGGYSI